jgi:hypothetical protein
MKNFMICTPHQILFLYSKENEARGILHERGREMDRELQWEILMDREHLEGLGVDGRIILKKIL